MTRYVALLRGINVGGRNIIKMAELRACLHREGFLDVATYIQSGNVIFSTIRSRRATVVSRVEALLSAEFNYRASLVLRTLAEMQNVVARAPDEFGAEPLKYRYDVLFLKEPVTASSAITLVPNRDGVDEVHAGSKELYYRRLISKATQSQLNRLASLPIYGSITIRNWNTTLRLLEMLSG